MHWVITTSLFRFKDDLTIDIRSEEGRQLLDIRSKSRKGEGDPGQNARHVRSLSGEPGRPAGLYCSDTLYIREITCDISPACLFPRAWHLM